jgi:predicted aspartyl protease
VRHPRRTGPVPIPRSAQASPAANVYFSRSNYDGHRLTAVIDTGSQVTVLATASARALGLTEGVLSRDHSVTTQGVAGEPLSSRVHRFATLEVGDISIRDPEVVVTDLKLNEADIVLGVDFLSSRHLLAILRVPSDFPV